ncbi:MAG: flagellar hook capping FlgD N-terminal domain-containing protein [Burkholderiaceae bacterium]
MFSTALTTSQIDAYNASGTAAAKSADPKAEQDKFMTMLVAQLNNQDPLNPMDNAQMTTQMAQINTVSGIQELNKTMTSMAAQFGSLQALQGVSLIGRTALVEGSTPVVEEEVAYGGFELAGAADSVQVNILGKAGQVLGTASMGAMATGQQFFQVPLAGVDPTQVGSFTVAAKNGQAAVTAKNINLMPIASVGMQNGALKLTASNGTSFGYDQVLGYR